MKKTKKRSKRNPRLTVNKESVRKLAGPELPEVAGGATYHNCNNNTVTFPFCCRSL